MASGTGADQAALDKSNRESHPLDAAVAEKILKEAKQIMDRLGVVFFLRQGTCLGAIRDNGFIQWDDDLDLGSVIGLHGFAEESIDRVVDAFRGNGFFVKVSHYDHYMSVSIMKASLRIDWACYRIIDDSIFHFPGSRIPVRLLTQLKEIDFLGEKFLVPNPPEEYLRFKYGADWMTPKRTGYEKDILDLIPATPLPGRAGRLKRLLTGRILPWRACRLRVLDHDGNPVSNADVVIHGLGRYRTNRHGYTKFYPPGREWFAFVISYGGHEEVLYMEEIEPGEPYIYRPDPSVTSGRWSALLPA